jgi:hypothetical protein
MSHNGKFELLLDLWVELGHLIGEIDCSACVYAGAIECDAEECTGVLHCADSTYFGDEPGLAYFCDTCGRDGL